MKRSFRILALCLAALCVLPLAAGAAAPQTATLDPSWFEGDTSLYHHGLAQASIILAAAAYNEHPATFYGTAFQIHAQGGGNWPDTTLALLNHTIASAELNGQTVISVVFQDAKSAEQFQSIADFDGRNHGFTAGENSEIAALLASANAALDNLASVITDNSCVWISGYGYGGGAAELLAAMLNGETFDLGDTPCGYETNADVRCYAFGTPAVSTRSAEATHKNIFIINNPEDLLVYLPGEEWGYRHFGNVIEMNTFNGEYTATAEQKTVISQNYKSYCDESFYVYAEGPAPVQAVAADIYSQSAQTLGQYYTTLYPTISDGLDAAFSGSTSKLISVATSLLSKHGYLVEFVLKYGLHESSIWSLLGSDLKNLTFYELICAHTSSCYLAWMMATDHLTDLSGATTDALERWMEASVSGEIVTYSASIPGSDTLWLAVYNADGKMLKVEALGSGLIAETSISVPNADFAKLFLLDGNYCPIE